MKNSVASNNDNLPEIPVNTEPESQLELEIRSLTKQAKEQLSSELFDAIEKISPQLSRNGLSLEEACLLANYNYEAFKQHMEITPLISRIIQMKELTFKRDLMATLAQKARSGDDKMAQWLLEKKYPAEFGNRKGGTPESGKDMLFEAIDYIQKTGDSSPLVSGNSSRAMVVKDNKEKENDVIKRVKDFLS